MFRRITRVLKSPPRVWLMVFQAFFLSGWYRFRVLNYPFAQISDKLGKSGYETEANRLDESLIRQVRFAVLGVCNHTPWKSECLIQALTARKLLVCAGLPCTLYMGVRRGESGDMLAHAWLRCGDIYVTGGNGSKSYTITGIFGDCSG